MIHVLSDLRDRVFGRGASAIMTPVFDGALKPNTLLKLGRPLATFAAPEDLCTDGQRLIVADGLDVKEVSPSGDTTVLFSEDRAISALAGFAGGVAVARNGEDVVIRGGGYDGTRLEQVDGQPLNCVNAIAAEGTRLLLSDGSRRRGPDKWRHDVMEMGQSGRVHEWDLATGKTRTLAKDLGYAFGVAAHRDSMWVSESWKHRLMAFDRYGKRRVIHDQLPGYPSRMAPASDGGMWVTVLCARTQLVEFVLRERRFRERMVKWIDPDLWVSPQVQSSGSFHEPLQMAAQKQLGIIKPWAPSRTYGLVIKYDAEGRAAFSFHDRADGTVHGIVAAVEAGGSLYVLSKAMKAVLKLDLAELEKKLTQ